MTEVSFKNYIKGKAVAIIDYANLKAWAKNKDFLLDLMVLAKFLKESGAEKLLFYYGQDAKNPSSEKFLQKVAEFGFEVKTKPVQYFHVNLFNLLQKPFNQQWLNRLEPNAKRILLDEAQRLSQQGINLLSPKANFDVEITVDMINLSKEADCFILFSGDGDFAPLIEFLQKENKKIFVLSGKKFLSGKLAQIANLVMTMEQFSKNVAGFLTKNPRTNRG